MWPTVAYVMIRMWLLLVVIQCCSRFFGRFFGRSVQSLVSRNRLEWSPSPKWLARWGLLLLSLLLHGCYLEQKPQPVYLSLKFHERDRLQLAPHVRKTRARPTEKMAATSEGTGLRFRVLDKRTLQIHSLVANVGKRFKAPWTGSLYPIAYIPDLVIRDGKAIHGPTGHFNPAVWIILEDETAQPIYEGWMFARDSTQTAWDHFRYDLTFLGKGKAVPEGLAEKGLSEKRRANKNLANKKRAEVAVKPAKRPKKAAE